MDDWVESAFIAHSPALRRYLELRLPEPDVEDALGEVFEIASTSTRPDHPLAWLIGVARNVTLRMHTRRYTSNDLILKIADSEFVHSFTEFDDENPTLRLVTSALCEIPAESARIVELVYLLNIDRKTVCDMEGISRTALDVRLHRARKLLAKVISKLNQERA